MLVRSLGGWLCDCVEELCVGGGHRSRTLQDYHSTELYYEVTVCFIMI